MRGFRIVGVAMLLSTGCAGGKSGTGVDSVSPSAGDASGLDARAGEDARARAAVDAGGDAGTASAGDAGDRTDAAETPSIDASSSDAGVSEPIDANTGDAGQPDCSGPVLHGSVVIHNEIDVAQFARYAQITGDLQIDPSGLAGVTLPRLCAVAGTLSLSMHGIALALPELRSVGGLAADSSNLALPALESVGNGGISVVGDTVAMPVLSFVGGDITLSQERFVDMSALTAAPSLTIEGPVSDGATFKFSKLDSIAGELASQGTSLGVDMFPVLRTVGTLHVAPPLATVELPSLQTIGSLSVLGPIANVVLAGATEIDALEIDQSITAPNLQMAAISIDGSQAMRTVDLAFPKLTRGALSGGGFSIGAFDFSSLATATKISIGTAIASTSDLVFPSLVSCDDLVVDATGAPAGSTLGFRAPLLARVQSVPYFRVPGDVELPSLTDAPGLDARTPGALDVRSLRTVSGTVDVDGHCNLAALSSAGSVIIAERGSALELPLLTNTTGDLNVGQTAVTSVDLSALRTVGGTLLVTAPDATSVDIHAIETVGGDFIARLDGAAAVSTPLLATVTGALDLRTKVDVSLPALATTSKVHIEGANVSVPLLVTTSALSIGPALSTDLPILETVSGPMNVTGTIHLPVLRSVTGTASIGATPPALSLPALVSTGSLNLGSDTLVGLTTIDMPNFTDAGTCLSMPSGPPYDGLRTQLASAGWSGSTNPNGCP